MNNNDMSEDEKETKGKERVSVHVLFPALVLELLATQVASQFTNGTMVIVDMGEENRLSPCHKRHIHIQFTPDTPILEADVMLVIAFATAMVCDQRKQWVGPKPSVEKVVAVIDSMIKNPGLESISDVLDVARSRAERIVTNAEHQEKVLH